MFPKYAIANLSPQKTAVTSKMSLRPNIKHLIDAFPLAGRRFSQHINRRPQPPTPKQDPYAQLKEDPFQVLSDLWVKSFSQTPKPFQNLTGFLSKLDLWVLAYQRACAHATGSYPPKNAIPSHTLSSIVSLRDAVVHSQFRWNSKLDQLIRSPKEKPITLLSRRKLESILSSGDPPFQDRVVQEVLLMILEPVFEARFSGKSHAFRPGSKAVSGWSRERSGKFDRIDGRCDLPVDRFKPTSSTSPTRNRPFGTE